MRLSAPPITPGLIALTAGVVLIAFDGGYPLTVWYPTALFFLALVVVTTAVAPPDEADRPSRQLIAVLIVYAAFCGWGYLSMLWADAPGDAWHAANRALLYGLVLLAALLRPWTRREALAGLAVVAFGVAAVAIVVLLSAQSGSATDFFVEGRLSDPTGYPNATAAAWLIALWPALFLATTPLLGWVARGFALAAATVLCQAALLSQSRGALIAFVATAVVFVGFSPRRWPALLALTTVIGLTALAFDPLTAVRDVRESAGLDSAVDDAVRAIGASSLAALLLGAAGAAVGARLGPRLQSRGNIKRAGDYALAGFAVVALVAILVSIGSPARWLDDRWEDFKTSGYEQVEAGSTRFGGSLGSGRYDFYRVALDEFRRRPFTGVGGDNFAADYLLDRRTPEAPRHPHSLAFRLLGQLGLVGTGLFVAFLGLMGAAAVTAARRARSPAESAIVMGALGGSVFFLFHALADWLWAFPGLGVLAFGLAGLAVRTRGSAAESAPGELRLVRPGSRDSAWRSAASVQVVLVLLVLAVAVSLALPGIAARYTSSAYDGYRKDPDAALDHLKRAAELNPLSAEPLIARGVIARRVGRDELTLDALREAVGREPHNWFAFLELAMAEQRLKLEDEARRSAGTAVRLNPRQPVVREVRNRIDRGLRVDANEVERELFGQLQARLDPTSE